jgi:hypothetical protein
MTAPSRRYWVNTVSVDHVEGAKLGGFTQADHGADTRLRRLSVGDGIVFYSPRTSLVGGTPVQQFTAVATVVGDEPYRVEMSETFHPWRLDVQFAPCRPVGAKQLAPLLSFIGDPVHWGLPFRRGLFAIPEADYRLIVGEMRVDG